MKNFSLLSIRIVCCANFITALILTLLTSCSRERRTAPVYQPISPDYNSISLTPSSDTIRFNLDSFSFNKISIQNTFTDKGNTYIAFFDDLTKTTNIYDFNTRQLVKKVNIREKLSLPLGKGKMIPYVFGFDSILVAHQRTIYIIDSAGKQIAKLAPTTEQNFQYLPDLETFMPAFLVRGQVFLPNRVSSRGDSFSKLKAWNIFSSYDMAENKVSAVYNLPKTYYTNYYGHDFLDYGFCINSKGNVVCSFAADPLLYETDLKDYHRSYLAKSRLQTEDITAVSPDSLSDQKAARREYYKRYKYGAVYYDPYARRYLRIAKGPVNLEKKDSGFQNIIIFDENFKIVGESKIDPEIRLKSLFIGPDSNIYARIYTKDEYGINFIKFVYTYNKSNPGKLSQK